MNKNRMQKAILTLLVSLLIGCSSEATNQSFSYEKLQADADALNAKAPYMSDKDTLVMKAVAKEGVYEIHNMLIHLDLSNMDKDVIKSYRKYIKDILTYISCTVDGLKGYPENNTILSWHYYDKRKAYFFSHDVSAKTCEEMPQK
ncbi:MAG: hypothetical protein AAEF23_04445 [Gammaproteobacteria bacterium]